MKPILGCFARKIGCKFTFFFSFMQTILPKFVLLSAFFIVFYCFLAFFCCANSFLLPFAVFSPVVVILAAVLSPVVVILAAVLSVCSFHFNQIACSSFSFVCNPGILCRLSFVYCAGWEPASPVFLSFIVPAGSRCLPSFFRSSPVLAAVLQR